MKLNICETVINSISINYLIQIQFMLAVMLLKFSNVQNIFYIEKIK